MSANLEKVELLSPGTFTEFVANNGWGSTESPGADVAYAEQMLGYIDEFMAKRGISVNQLQNIGHAAMWLDEELMSERPALTD